MGFTLIHRSVLEKLAVEYADDPWHYFGHDIINNSHVGEDLTFCNRARKAGFSVWGHGGVLLGHTKAKTLVVSDVMNPDLALQPRPLYMGTAHHDKRVLNVGGGSKGIPIPARFDGWEHVLLDIDPNSGADLIIDARKLAESTEVPAESFDAVYCAHNLEHYHEHEVPTVLAGFMHVLRSAGEVEIRVPNLDEVFEVMRRDDKGLDEQAYVSPAGPVTFRDMIFGFGPR